MRTVWLDLQLHWRRMGMVPTLLCTLFALLLFALSWSGYQAWQAQNLKQDLLRQSSVDSAVVTAPTSASPFRLAAARVHAFQGQLGQPEQVELLLQSIFDAAHRDGLTLAQGRYLAAENVAGGYQTLHIELPLAGTYSAVRSFAERVLLTLPCAALEQIQFRRETASDSMLKAQLNFVLYLNRQGPLLMPSDLVAGRR